MKASRTLKVSVLARVEGEGALDVRIRDGRPVEVKLRIFEPPRFFEAFLRGRAFTEAPDITARICGICPVAYQMSAVHAMETACGVTVDGPLRALRRLLYCGEWIESHVLHVFMLHAPDFLGYADAIRMAKDHPERVATALRMKKIGNELLRVVGGREIHPVNVRVGGFYRLPSRAELGRLVADLEWARDAAIEAVGWTATLPCPVLERDYTLVALSHPDEYPLNEGRIVSSDGLDIAVEEYERHFVEEHVQHSHALHSRRADGAPYFVGPLARFALNFDRLTPEAARAARAAGIDPACRNPFKSIVVRAIETVFACEEALRIIAAWVPPARPSVDVSPKPATGWACTEAPRGILYHRYRIDATGAIVEAKIVPPTAQNQPTIEEDVRALVEQSLSLSSEDLTWRCEQAIRNYDPCISCATHFLRLTLHEE